MKENKKVLIITYYWPPSGGAGVQRWLKFTKYLPDLGWDPIIFTPENPQFDLRDESLETEVHSNVDVLKFPIWEPYSLFKRVSGTKELKQGQVLEDQSNSWLRKFSVFIRGNLFIPDPRRFWIKPSVNYLKEIIRTNEIKHVITTGPPHSMHLIGLQLKYLNPSIYWLADFRDPWTEWDIMKKFHMLPFVKRKHRSLEQKVLKAADLTLATGNLAAEDLKALGARRTAVLTNGFDEDVINREPKANSGSGLCLLHLGMLNENRLPLHFFQCLNRGLQRNKNEFEFRLTGIISPIVEGVLSELTTLKGVLHINDSIPHAQLTEEFKKADILLLLQTDSKESRSQLPGKLFEYLAQKKPILAFGDPTSDVSRILQQTSSGVMLSYDHSEAIEEVVQEILAGTFQKRFEFKEINQFSRKNITAKLADLLGSFDQV